MKSIFIIVIVLFLTGCFFNSDQTEYGTLEGSISIGPLCPVETNPPNPACLPNRETFDAYALAVFDAKHQKIIAEIMPEVPTGYFSLELTEGEYIVDFKTTRENSIGSANLPKNIAILPDGVLNIEINIDTGIR